MAGGDAEQRAETGLTVTAAVEAESEFIEVGLEVLAAQAMIDAQRPGLEVGEDVAAALAETITGDLVTREYLDLRLAETEARLRAEIAAVRGAVSSDALTAAPRTRARSQARRHQAPDHRARERCGSEAACPKKPRRARGAETVASAESLKQQVAR
jgi:hypothetical protein